MTDINTRIDCIIDACLNHDRLTIDDIFWAAAHVSDYLAKATQEETKDIYWRIINAMMERRFLTITQIDLLEDALYTITKETTHAY